jgi:hypothetical protein
MFDRFHSYAIVWQTYTAMMLVTLVPTEILRRLRLSPGRLVA